MLKFKFYIPLDEKENASEIYERYTLFLEKISFEKISETEFMKRNWGTEVKFMFNSIYIELNSR